jgi:hypothetical protein
MHPNHAIKFENCAGMRRRQMGQSRRHDLLEGDVFRTVTVGRTVAADSLIRNTETMADHNNIGASDGIMFLTN